MAELESRMLINGEAVAGPFGGFKQAGLGRELGRERLEAFQETKHVHIESEVAQKEWCTRTRATPAGTRRTGPR
jgi:hypothetical protein